jgi:tetratricopeptide (TPR) repeat protein
MPKGATKGLVATCIAVIPFSPALAQHCSSSWTAAYSCMEGCGGCPANGRNERNSGPSARDIAAERQRQADEAAYKTFIQEVDAAKAKRDWTEAIRLARQYQGVLNDRQVGQFIESMEFHIARDAGGAANDDAHDYPRAIELLQEALRHRPGDRDTLDALQTAKNNQAAAARRATLSTDVAALIATVQARPAPAPGSSLDFMSLDPRLEPTDSASGTGAFGTTTNPVHPGLDFSPGPAPVAVHNTADQLSSAAKSGADANREGPEAAKTESNCGFDSSACAEPESISTNAARSMGQTPGAADLAAHLGSIARNDVQIQQSMAYYQKLDSRKIDTQQKLAAIEQKIESHSGDGKVLSAQQATLNNDLNAYKAEETKTEEQIKKRTIAIHVPWIESPEK